MKPIPVVPLLALLAVSFGCAKPNPTGSVAVVDLDKIASALGWQDEISKTLRAAEEELQNQLQSVAQSATAAIDAAKREVIAEARLNADQVKLLNSIEDLRDLEKLPLTEAQRAQLARAVNQANLNFQTAQARAQQAMQEQRAALINRYRDRVRPVAKQIATDAGFQIVLLPDQSMLHHEPTADITDRVIEKLRTTSAAPFATPPTK